MADAFSRDSLDYSKMWKLDHSRFNPSASIGKDGGPVSGMRRNDAMALSELGSASPAGLSRSARKGFTPRTPAGGFRGSLGSTNMRMTGDGGAPGFGGASRRSTAQTPLRGGFPDDQESNASIGMEMENSLVAPPAASLFGDSFATSTMQASRAELAAPTDSRPEESEFWEQLNEMGEGNDVFPLTKAYEDICNKRVHSIERDISKGRLRRPPPELGLLREERNTWRLLFTLYSDRVASEGRAAVAMELARDYAGVSEVQRTQELFRSNGELREWQIVVRWLEAIAFEAAEYTNVEAGLPNTLNAVRERAKNAVTRMDPDAPFREEGKDVHADDKELERVLLRGLWSLVKAGQIEEAQELCRKSGVPWRAASLGGGDMYHDAAYAGEHSDDKAPRGNPYRMLWKFACLELSKQAPTEYERAVYGALCGNVTAMLPLLKSWADYVWAHFKVMADQELDRHLLDTRDSNSEDFQPSKTSIVDLSPHIVFEELARETNPTLKSEARHPLHVVQQHLILHEERPLIDLLASRIESDGEPLAPQLLRFAAHLVLFFRSIALPVPEHASIVILQKYVDHLIDTRQDRLVAKYTAQLPEEEQIETYARFLSKVTERTQREKCLTMAVEARLNTQEITKRVVTVEVRTDPEPMDQVAKVPQTTEDDKRKIKSIEWLTFDEDQIYEALRQSNVLLRSFLRRGKLDAARHLVRDILPRDPAARVEHQYREHVHLNEDEDCNLCRDTKDHRDIVDYLDATQKFDDWLEQLQKKPTAPIPPTSGRYSDELVYDREQRAFDSEAAKWREELETRTREAVAGLLGNERGRGVLQAPNGWLAHPQDEALRQKCIPEVVFMLHRIFQEMGQHDESMRLADLVADEHTSLYRSFSQDCMAHFLVLLRQTALLQLRTSPDPLGYWPEQHPVGA